MKDLRFAALALVHTIITIFTDKLIFIFPKDMSRLFVTDYLLCKLIVFIFLFYFYRSIYTAFIDNNRKDSAVYKTLVCGLPYLVPIIVAALIKMPSGYVTNDEYNILSWALNFEHNTWFSYLTVYYYICSLMLIPVKMGPVFMKLILEYITAGYTIYRIRDYFDLLKVKRPGNRECISLAGGRINIPFYFFGYLIFLLYPFIAYITSAHRLPVYFLIYLMMIVTILFDMLKLRPFELKRHIWLLLAGAVLTQWRTEGIYLFILIPLLMFIAYPNLRISYNRETGRSAFGNVNGICAILIYLVLQILIWIPQNASYGAELSSAADDRMKPFYGYTITNMFRNGLDEEKNSKDLAIVDRYLSIDAIKAINEHYGDINYEDVLILYADGFVGVREEATAEDFFGYADALKRIFVNNPDVFIRTRAGAFNYAARPYHVSFDGLSAGALKGFIISLVKTVSYDLYIPLLTALILLIYSLIRRRWFSFLVFGGLMAHWAIVFVLAPASYFKYYFPLYAVSYLYLDLLLIQFIYNRVNKGQGEGISFIR